MPKRLDSWLGILVAAGGVISVVGLIRVLERRPEPAPEARPPAQPLNAAHGAEVPEPPEIASPAVLFSLAPGPEGCSWEMRAAPDFVPSVLRTTDRCPDDVLWMGSPGESELIYEDDGSLVRIGASGEPETLGLPQASIPLGRFVHFWMHAASARLRVGYLTDVPCVPDGGRCTYDLGARSIASERDADGWERFTLEEGWAVEPAGGADWSLPGWGTRGVAVAFESDSTGGWTMVSAAPTRSETDETPGLAVLDISEAPGTFSLYDLRAATSCSGHRRSSTGCERYTGALPAWLSERLRDELDEVGSLPSDAGTWIFPIGYADDPHIRGPVFLACGPACEPAPLSLPMTNPVQLSLSAKGPYLLVGREHRLTEAAVFAPAASEPILTLPAAASSVWLPR